MVKLYDGGVYLVGGETIVTDPLTVSLRAEELIQVSFYLADFTLMRSVVYTCGPLSEGLYANGDQMTYSFLCEAVCDLPLEDFLEAFFR